MEIDKLKMMCYVADRIGNAGVTLESARKALTWFENFK